MKPTMNRDAREQELAQALASLAASIQVNATHVRQAAEDLCHAIASAEIRGAFDDTDPHLAPFSPAEEPDPEHVQGNAGVSTYVGAPLLAERNDRDGPPLKWTLPKGPGEGVERVHECECGAGVERLSTWHDNPPGWTCRECGGFVPRDVILPGQAPASPEPPHAEVDNPQEEAPAQDRGQRKA